jgi:hypothetical protein
MIIGERVRDDAFALPGTPSTGFRSSSVPQRIVFRLLGEPFFRGSTEHGIAFSGTAAHDQDFACTHA